METGTNTTLEMQAPVEKTTAEKLKEKFGMVSASVARHNIEAAKHVARAQAGELCINAMHKIIVKSSPMMVRGYVTDPFGADVCKMVIGQLLTVCGAALAIHMKDPQIRRYAELAAESAAYASQRVAVSQLYENILKRMLESSPETVAALEQLKKVSETA